MGGPCLHRRMATQLHRWARSPESRTLVAAAGLGWELGTGRIWLGWDGVVLELVLDMLGVGVEAGEKKLGGALVLVVLVGARSCRPESRAAN